MWLLETDGEVFQGKTIWLRPGRRFLFGRTNSEAGQFVISDKTISRKHLIIEIADVAPGDGSKLDVFSKVTIQDQATKIGTYLNGTQIRGERITLQGTFHEIKLGHYRHVFRLSWKPVVFTFASLSRDQTKQLMERVEKLDIKVSAKFIQGVSTHVVSEKRNTPKGLQALIQANYIVTGDFVSAIESAANLGNNPGALSALESDFYANWPTEFEYLPPKREEPTDCPDEAYKPNLARQDVFQGYTFIMYAESQYNALLPPITVGRGKALLHPALPHETRVDDFVRYVKSVAGEKGLGEVEEGSEGKGIVVVRYQPPTHDNPDHPWYINFIQELSIRLDHRLMEQNEFLDAILKNDASSLRRPLEYEPVLSGAPSEPIDNHVPTSSTAQSDDLDAPTTQIKVSGSSPPHKPVRRGRPRRQLTTKFKGFDEGWDEPSNSMVSDIPAASESQEHGLFVSQDTNMAHSQAELPSSPILNPPQKRSLSPVSEDVMDQLLPAATHLKKRRLAETAARRARGETTPPPAVMEPPIKASPKPKKKQVDLLEVARKRKEELDEIARADREALENALDGVNIDDIRRLTIIEEMPVVRNTERIEKTARADDSTRWDERWNGRKNFKKFRRRGADHNALPKLRNIVPLNEVRKKGQGGFWETFESDTSSRRDDHSIPTTISGPSVPSVISSAAPSTRSGPQPQPEIVTVSDDEPSHDEIEPSPPPPSTVMSERRTQAYNPSTRSSVPPSSVATTTRTHGKRSAASIPLAMQSPAKKLRQSTLRRRVDEDDEEDDNDSDDELKFRFKR